MKKFMALISAAAIALSLCACAPKECELCGREEKTKKYRYEGESAYLCEDCGQLADAANAMKNLIK